MGPFSNLRMSVVKDTHNFEKAYQWVCVGII